MVEGPPLLNDEFHTLICLLLCLDLNLCLFLVGNVLLFQVVTHKILRYDVSRFCCHISYFLLKNKCGITLETHLKAIWGIAFITVNSDLCYCKQEDNQTCHT